MYHAAIAQQLALVESPKDKLLLARLREASAV